VPDTLTSHLPPPLGVASWQPTGGRRKLVGLTVLALHLLALGLLAQTGRHVVRVASLAALPVKLVAQPAQMPPAQGPAQGPARLHRPEPSQPRLAPLVIRVAGAEATQPVPPLSDDPSGPPAPALVAQPTASAQEPERVAAPVQPKPLPAVPMAVPGSSLRYRVEPAVEMPRLSRRAGEQGRVQLRVVFDTQGVPCQVQLHKSSGFERLDAQALEAMRAARIQPFIEQGQAIEVLAIATLEYGLDS
jgi:periplasmic protein TonB